MWNIDYKTYEQTCTVQKQSALSPLAYHHDFHQSSHVLPSIGEGAGADDGPPGTLLVFSALLTALVGLTITVWLGGAFCVAVDGSYG